MLSLSQQPTLTLIHLPPEIIFRILQFASISDTFSTGRAHTSLFWLTTSYSLIKQQIKEKWPSIYHRFTLVIFTPKSHQKKKKNPLVSAISLLSPPDLQPSNPVGNGIHRHMHISFFSFPTPLVPRQMLPNLNSSFN